MRKFLIVTMFLALSGAAGQAQTPRVELFTGLSYGQFNPGGLLTVANNGIGRHFSLPGVEITPQFNFSKSFGIIADISAYGGTGDVDALAEHVRIYNFLAGPQLTARNLGPFNLFVRGLVGVSRGRVSSTNFDSTGKPFTVSLDENRLAYGFGGGIDLNVSKHIALRLVQIDYLRNSFTNCNAANATTLPGCPNTPPGVTPGASKPGRQNNLRLAVGFEWRF
jgi:opacity protein-like surface antigen